VKVWPFRQAQNLLFPQILDPSLERTPVTTLAMVYQPGMYATQVILLPFDIQAGSAQLFICDLTNEYLAKTTRRLHTCIQNLNISITKYTCVDRRPYCKCLESQSMSRRKFATRSDEWLICCEIGGKPNSRAEQVQQLLPDFPAPLPRDSDNVGQPPRWQMPQPWRCCAHQKFFSKSLL
jgi:hypothetical protein